MTTPSPPVGDVLTTLGFHTLGPDPSLDAVETVLRRLKGSADASDPLRRETLRGGAVKALRSAGIPSPARLVDAALGTAQEKGAEASLQGTAVALKNPEHWQGEVDVAEVLAEMVGVFRRFLVLPRGAATALALWVLHAHAHDAATVSPILALTSPVKRCGKTTLLFVLGALVPRPLPSSNITGPTVFRAADRWKPTLLVDEADSFIKDKEELRGILNSGHHRGGSFVIRTAGDEHEPRVFNTWSPKVIALIGKLPDTLMDRSIEISMQRRGPGEEVERLRLDRLSELEHLRRRAWAWAQERKGELLEVDPVLPDCLNDRQRDNWRPLVAIAGLAGGTWPERARQAAALLSGVAEDDEVGTLLLMDLRKIFEDRGTGRITSGGILEELLKLEERPWPEWRRGQPLSPQTLARLLKPYGVKPRPLAWGSRHPDGTRGYEVSDFSQAWKRYLPVQAPVEEPQEPQDGQSPNGLRSLPPCKGPPSLAGEKSGENLGATSALADLALGEGKPGAEFSRSGKVIRGLFGEVGP